VTDGPYKNADLPSRWKKFGNSLIDDAADPEYRTERAEHALMRDLPASFRSLVHEIDQAVKHSFSEESARLVVLAIVDKHSKTPTLYSDTLQRYLNAYISRPMAIDMAVTLALDSTIKREASKIRVRLTEESMHARDRNDLKETDYKKALGNLSCLDDINVSKIRQDVRRNRKAPKAAALKRLGDDDGPRG